MRESTTAGAHGAEMAQESAVIHKEVMVGFVIERITGDMSRLAATGRKPIKEKSRHNGISNGSNN
jgi:hypothetical protein